MNIQWKCLLAVLLVLPVAHADAGQVTINIPVEITNAPKGTTQINADCQVGVGPAPGTTLWPAASYRGGDLKPIPIPSSGSYRGVVQVVITAGDDATHYKCWLNQNIGQPAFHGPNFVSGPIPVTVMVTPR